MKTLTMTLLALASSSAFADYAGPGPYEKACNQAAKKLIQSPLIGTQYRFITAYLQGKAPVQERTCAFWTKLEAEIDLPASAVTPLIKICLDEGGQYLLRMKPITGGDYSAAYRTRAVEVVCQKVVE